MQTLWTPLLKKAKNFQNFENSFKNSDYNDFLFVVSDSLEIKVKNNVPTIHNDSDLKYVEWVKEAFSMLDFSKFSESFLCKTFDIPVEYTYTVSFKFDVKFNSKTQEFELRNCHNPIVRLCQNDDRFCYSIWASDSDSENLEICKFSEENDAKNLIKNLIKIRDEIVKLNFEALRILNPIFREDLFLDVKNKKDFEISTFRLESLISIEDLDLQNYDQWFNVKKEIISRWLIKQNKLLTFVEVVRHGYFSSKEKWIQPCFEWLGEDWTYQIVPC